MGTRHIAASATSSDVALLLPLGDLGTFTPEAMDLVSGAACDDTVASLAAACSPHEQTASPFARGVGTRRRVISFVDSSPPPSGDCVTDDFDPLESRRRGSESSETAPLGSIQSSPEGPRVARGLALGTADPHMLRGAADRAITSKRAATFDPIAHLPADTQSLLGRPLPRCNEPPVSDALPAPNPLPPHPPAVKSIYRRGWFKGG